MDRLSDDSLCLVLSFFEPQHLYQEIFVLNKRVAFLLRHHASRVIAGKLKLGWRDAQDIQSSDSPSSATWMTSTPTLVLQALLARGLTSLDVLSIEPGSEQESRDSGFMQSITQLRPKELILLNNTLATRAQEEPLECRKFLLDVTRECQGDLDAIQAQLVAHFQKGWNVGDRLTNLTCFCDGACPVQSIIVNAPHLKSLQLKSISSATPIAACTRYIHVLPAAASLQELDMKEVPLNQWLFDLLVRLLRPGLKTFKVTLSHPSALQNKYTLRLFVEKLKGLHELDFKVRDCSDQQQIDTRLDLRKIKGFDQLRTLRLDGWNLTDPGADLLPTSSSHLKCLEFANLDKRDWTVLTRILSLLRTQLEELSLLGVYLPKAASLFRGKIPKRLTKLSITAHSSPGTVSLFWRTRKWPKLIDLCIQCLSKCPSMKRLNPRLERLTVVCHSTKVFAERGIENLVHLKSLKVLCWERPSIDERYALRPGTYLANLCELYLDRVCVSKADRFFETCPKLTSFFADRWYHRE